MGIIDHAIQFASRHTQRPYECRSCRTSFEVEYHVCPECSGFSVERPV